MNTTARRPTVAMVSEHASPLAVLGGVDAGGQNVHVAALAEHVARRGWRVEVFTRRDDPTLPERIPLCPGVVVVHVDAGPPVPIPKDELLPHMARFAAQLHDAWSTSAARHRPRPFLDVRPSRARCRTTTRAASGPDLPRPRRRQAAAAGCRRHQPAESPRLRRGARSIGRSRRRYVHRRGLRAGQARR